MRIKTALAVMALLMVSCVCTFAGSDRVYDLAGLFTAAQTDTLSERAEEIGGMYDIDVAILTISVNDKSDSQEYAEDFYLSEGFGRGVMMLIDMDTRNVWITVKDAEYVISNGDVESILDSVFEYMPDGDYYNAASAFLKNVDYYFDLYAQDPYYTKDPSEWDGNDYVPAQKDPITVGSIITPLGIIVSLVAATVYLLVLCRKNKSVKMADNANSFAQLDTFMLTQTEDKFVRTYTTRVRIQSDNDTSRSHGGGGGSSSGGGGGGFSGGGRSF